MYRGLCGQQWVLSWQKRIADLVLWVAWLAPVLFLTVLGAVLVIAFDRSRPFFAQRRIGKDGKVFTLYKLNTMGRFCGADSSKGADDPRATKLGVFLRWTIWDEIPQILINVPLGTMSMVGPRPLIAEDFALMKSQLGTVEYSEWYKAYISCLPGWTGKFGVDSRKFPNQSTAYLRARKYHDISYSLAATPLMDAKIIMLHFKLFYLDLRHRKPSIPGLLLGYWSDKEYQK